MTGGIFIYPNLKKQDTSNNQQLVEWNKYKNKEIPLLDSEIDWKVKVKTISSIGGLYAKGYIYDYKSYPVHITFDPTTFDIEKDYPRIRQEIGNGDVLKLRGKCVGVTEEGEVWIEVTNYSIYE